MEVPSGWSEKRIAVHKKLKAVLEAAGISESTADMLSYFLCESVPSNCAEHLREIAAAAWVPKRREWVRVRGSGTVGQIHRFFVNGDGTLLASLKGSRRGGLAIAKPSILEPYTGEEHD